MTVEPSRSTIHWPPPLPGRVRWAWLLDLRSRAWRIRPLLRLLEGRVPEGAFVIDVGSGPGYISAHLSNRVGIRSVRWILIDPQRGMFRRTPRKRKGTSFEPDRLVGDGVDLPIDSGSADLVLSLGVLCCMADSAVSRGVAEIARILRPGGLLLLGVPRRRGSGDEALLQSAGLQALVRLQPGRGLFQKGH